MVTPAAMINGDTVGTMLIGWVTHLDNHPYCISNLLQTFLLLLIVQLSQFVSVLVDDVPEVRLVSVATILLTDQECPCWMCPGAPLSLITDDKDDRAVTPWCITISTPVHP